MRLQRRDEINSKVQNANDAVVNYAKGAGIPLAPGADKPGQSQANRERTERDVAFANRASNAGDGTGASATGDNPAYVRGAANAPGTEAFQGPNRYTGPSLAYKPGPGVGQTVAIPRSTPADVGGADWEARAKHIDDVVHNRASDAPAAPRYGPDSTKGKPATGADIAALNANDRAIASAKGSNGTPEMAGYAAGTGDKVFTPYGTVSSTDAAHPQAKDYSLDAGANGGVVPSLAAQQEILAKYPQISDPNSPAHAAFLKAWKVATDGKKPGDVVDNHLAIAENAVTTPQSATSASRPSGNPDASDKATPGKDIAKSTPAPTGPSAAASAGQTVADLPGAVADNARNYWDAAKGLVGSAASATKDFVQGATGNPNAGATAPIVPGGTQSPKQIADAKARAGPSSDDPTEYVSSAVGAAHGALVAQDEDTVRGDVYRPNAIPVAPASAAPSGSTPTYGQNPQPWTQGASAPTPLDHAQAYADAFHKSVAPMFKAAQQSVSTAPATPAPDNSMAKGTQSPLNGGNDLNPAAPMVQPVDNNQAKGSQSSQNGGNDISSPSATPANSSAQGNQSPQNANPDADLPKYRTGSN